MNTRLSALYSFVEQYIARNQLTYASDALNLVKNSPDDHHCLEVCKLLIDLHMEMSKKESDILLSAALLHYLPKNAWDKTYDFLPEILEIIDLLSPQGNLSNEEQEAYFGRIQTNKLALLVSLAERGNLVQNLHEYSIWNAHHYISETRACYYPMCIYGKENYHELLGPISILMEKIKTLLEVAEVLIRRYEVREAELIQDILALKEENATIRGIIRKFQN